MNKILVTLLVALYTIPYVFLGMYCQWIDYGLLMTSLTFLTFIPPFVYAYFCAKKRLKYVLIYGNILYIKVIGNEYINFSQQFNTFKHNIYHEIKNPDFEKELISILETE